MGAYAVTTGPCFENPAIQCQELDLSVLEEEDYNTNEWHKMPISSSEVLAKHGIDPWSDLPDIQDENQYENQYELAFTPDGDVVAWSSSLQAHILIPEAECQQSGGGKQLPTDDGVVQLRETRRSGQRRQTKAMPDPLGGAPLFG